MGPTSQPPPDRAFADARLARLYDPLDPDRSDLDVYAAMAHEFRAGSVLDVGCGTGTLACLLAGRGVDVTAVDPAAASLEIARRKQGADRVRWIHGDATDLPTSLAVDLAVMTGNVAQVFVTDEAWTSTLVAVRDALAPDGRFAFETRVPAREAWTAWTREQSRSRRQVPGVGPVEHWVDLIEVGAGLVTFRWTVVRASTGEMLTSDSTLRFREHDEVVRSLDDTGLRVVEVRDAPDRPGLEWVFVAEPA